LSLAFQSVSLLEEEWRAIREAQQARGAWSPERLTLRNLGSRLSGLVALIAPAIVLTTRRAWAMTEAASARGLDAPNRQTYHRLAMKPLDWLLLGVTATALAALWQ
ncbi:MAG: energy-coupling factor transporter transmembrane protein EcfT, partial [Anaerolineae bacterium]|nr:energy-coupling factor transporter transmembrane protein EcfT [Anaerolineae bacterium]